SGPGARATAPCRGGRRESAVRPGVRFGRAAAPLPADVGMSAANVVLPLLTSVASFRLAALVLEQWRRRRRSFQAVWGLGMLWYGISSGAEFLGSALGWGPALYRAWYLFGALFVAAYLG